MYCYQNHICPQKLLISRGDEVEGCFKQYSNKIDYKKEYSNLKYRDFKDLVDS